MNAAFRPPLIVLGVLLLCQPMIHSQQLSSRPHSQQTLENSVPGLAVLPGSRGDLDGNGTIDIVDLLRARDIALGRRTNPSAAELFAGDMNSDGKIDAADVGVLRGVLLRVVTPPPTILAVTPSPARQGDQVEIQGAGFDLAAENNNVTLGGNPVKVVAASALELVVEIPAAAASGEIVASVRGQKSNKVTLTVAGANGGPLISTIVPASALRREEITIQGSGFGATAGAGTVQFRDLQSASGNIVSWSDSRIVIKIPDSAFPGLVTVLANGKPSNRKYLNVTVVQITAPKPEDIVKRSDGLEYVRNEVVLDFKDYLPLDSIASFLQRNNLVQTGLIYRRRLVAARIDDGREPFGLAAALSGSPLLEGAYGVPVMTLKTVLTESYAPADLPASYDAQKGYFNRNRALSNYHHFAMNTYAGHRLVEAILGNLSTIPPDVRVAVLDGGLGDGTTNDPAEFHGRIRSPTTVGFLAATGFSSGLTDVKSIPDLPNHGTKVAGNAAGGGVVSLGTGKHVNLRPIQTSNSEGKFDPYILAGALEIAMDDPQVSAINLSLGSYDGGRSATVNAIGKKFSGGIYGDEVEDAAKKGKIVVIAAGNESVDASLSSPAYLAPDEPRGAGALPIINVSATSPSFTVSAPINDATYELLAGFSNTGSKISVAAPGDFGAVFSGGLLDNDYTATGALGTSFSAPIVAGLAAEMTMLDKVQVLLGRRSAQMSAGRIVQLIEATADDLGSPGWDPAFGHGRVNVWKALLATANGGTAAEVTSPDWYGFEVRASLEAPTQPISDVMRDNYLKAQFSIDGAPIEDRFNGNAPWTSVSLTKRVPPRTSPDGRTLLPLPYDANPVSDFLTTFSISSDELKGTGPATPKLQLRQEGKPSSAPPIFELPLDLQKLQAGVQNLVTYDGFIFTVQVPRVLRLVSMRNGAERALTTTVNGKSVTYPVAAIGDTLRFEISFAGFTPTGDNTAVQFVAPGRVVTEQPFTVVNTTGQPVTSTFNAIVPEFAQTGPATIKTLTTDAAPMASFASLSDLIIPRVVGVNPSGRNPGDLIQIAINVPHFTPTTANTRLVLPGSSTEVPPEQVLPGPDASVTNVLALHLPAALADGPVKVLVNVDGNARVQFEGGGGTLFNKVLYAGTLRITKLLTAVHNQLTDITPAPGKDLLPTRFILNKTQQVQNNTTVDAYFLSAPAENSFTLPFGPKVTAVPSGSTLTFQYSASAGGVTYTVQMLFALDATGTITNGTYTATVPGLLQIDGEFEISPETGPPALYNGIAVGRFIFQSKSGDPKLLQELQETPSGSFDPVGFIQVGNLVAMTSVPTNSGTQGSPTPLASLLRKRTVEGQRAASRLPAVQGTASVGYGLVGYVVGAVTGARATFVVDDAVLFPAGDPDPANNATVTYKFSKVESAVTGTITFFFDFTRPDDMGNPQKVNATYNFSYDGSVLDEASNKVGFLEVNPAPEQGFPPVNGTTVTIARASVGYNFVAANQGTVVLRAFKNNDPTAILGEMEMPIALTRNMFGSAVFSGFVIPNVGPDVTSISLVAGLRPAGGTGFVAQSVVLTYAR